MSLPTAFHATRSRAQEHPDVIAIQSENVSLSYVNLDAQLGEVGRFLIGKGVSTSDRVLVMLPQGIEMALVSLGVMRHAVCVPVNPEYTSKEVDELLKSVNPKLIFTNSTLKPKIQECPNILFDTSVIEVKLNSDKARLHFSEKIVEDNNSELTLPDQDDLALLLLTSGSTSTPKLVPLTHQNILTAVQNLVSSLQLTDQDRCLNTMTMFHVGGLLDLLIAPLTIGCTIMCPEGKGSEAFFSYFNKFKPTWYQCVPTMLADIINYSELHPETTHQHKGFRFIRSVSSSISEELMLKAEKVFGVPIIEIYGMTETAGVITSNPLSSSGRKITSVGKVCGETQVKVIDGQNNPLPEGKVGEVIVSGEHVFSGYLNNAERNKDLFVGEWFKTGDTGFINTDGYLFLKGRVKELINRGGEKISPIEIDHIIESHPDVIEAAAYAIPHPSLGEEVAAAVVLKSESNLSKNELSGFLAEQLAQFKLPRVMHFLKQLPRNSGGKIQRHLLTQNFSNDAENSLEIVDAPETQLEKIVAKLWKQILEAKQVRRHDDFFDLGGDSLKALLFISELENSIKATVEPKVIYEYPVLIELTNYLEDQKLFTSPKEKTTTEDLYNELRRLMAHWSGSRLNGNALIVGRNTLGSKTPIFWCTNGVDYFEEQVKFLDADQPVYGMVSLIESKFRSAENNAKAGEFYAKEIMALFPKQEVIIGGWCEGAKIVIDTARVAKEAGVKVKLLFMQDNFIPKPYDGPVALFYSNHGVHRFRSHFHDPDFGVGKYYTGGFANYFEDIEHTDFYQNTAYMRQFAERLKQAIQEISDKQQLQNEPSTKFQLLAEQDCKARLKIEGQSLFLSRLQKTEINVEIENTSNTTWMPTDQSGLRLMVTWLDITYTTMKKVAFDLPNSLGPGEQINMSVELDLPENANSMKLLFLQVDMVDDGVARFSTYGSKAIRFPTISAPLMLYPVILITEISTVRWLEKIIGYRKLKPKSFPILMTNLTVKSFRKFRDLTYNLIH